LIACAISASLAAYAGATSGAALGNAITSVERLINWMVA
jgi:hypothetical protein